MAAKMVDKVKGLFGFGEYDDEYEDFEDDELMDEVEEVEPIISNKKSNKVVNIHTSSSAKVTIKKPTVYDDATEICEALKARRIVVINSTALETKIAQRLLDFVSGACFALAGELQEVEKGVYILSPSNVEVTNELKSELSSKGIFNWSK
ncbi:MULTISPECIES: cell division protein SepF [Clostridium]|uniref:Cell division protein SepF n=1 Tax=Clostridium paridis TaxID=2803863 RepID=A0A937FDV8_9CLOT|nr:MULTISPECIES: cell division protein SepF [Clostridium]MBL4931045.1 cell division protein SepF [Clostridium paridis]MDD7793967.1 cell division protein SepF [Clostridium sp. 'White wine YQ']